MDIKFGYSYKCCEKCSNNPKNNPHASGICNCVLPYMEGTRTGDYVQTSTSTTYTYVKEGNKWVSKDMLKRE